MSEYDFNFFVRGICRTKFGNKPGHVEVGGKLIYFRSKFEARWARYLQFLLEAKEILTWEYEPTKFRFEKSPYVYIPDFMVTEKDATVVWQECKGVHTPKTNMKFRRLVELHPDIVLELILLNIPKGGKGATNRGNAERYVRRIIDASEIFRQIGF